MNEKKTGKIENIHLDWMQCTFDYSAGMEILNSGCLGNFEADKDARGLHTYEQHQMSYLGCEYHYSPNNKRMGVHVRLNGETLANYRAFPQTTDLEILRLFAGARKFTRLDVALNSTNIRLLSTLCNRWKSANVVSNKRKFEIILSGEVPRDRWGDSIEKQVFGRTIYIGGKTSEKRYRAYDKAKQLQWKEGNWLRIEGQYRDDVATAMARGLLADNAESELTDKAMNYDIATDDILSATSAADLFDVVISEHSRLKVGKKETSLKNYFDTVLKVVGKNLHREETADFLAGVSRMIELDL
jgi:hypothetical protein